MARPLPSLLAAAALLAACQAPLTTPDARRSPRASAAPGPQAAASAAPDAPASAAASAQPVGSLLQRPQTPSVTMRGSVAIDASYLVAVQAGSVLSNGGASLAAAGPGLLLSNNGGALVGNNGGALIANNSGNIISDKGAGIISDKGAGYLLAQAAAASPAFGAQLPAAGMRVHVVSLVDGTPVAVGVDGAGEPVYSVYTNLGGGFEPDLPTDLTGTVRVVAEAPETQDPRLSYPLFARTDREDAGALDEDTAAMTRYVRQGITARFASVLRAHREARALGAVDDGALVQGFFPNTEEVVPAEVLAFFGRLLGEIMAEAAKNPAIGPEDDGDLARRLADAVFARGPDLGNIDVLPEVYSSDERAEMLAAPHGTGPVLTMLTAILKDLRLAVVAAGAGKTSAEVEAFFAAKPYLQTANRQRPAGATPYRIRKAADLADFIAEEYAPLVRGQVYAGGEPLTNTEIRGLSEAVVTDLGLPETHVTALYAAGGAIALAMAPAAADPATKETFFAIVRGWDR